MPCCNRCNLLRNDFYSYEEFLAFSETIKTIDLKRGKLKLINHLKDSGAIKFGNFILASGCTSDYYIDIKLAFLNPKSSKVISNIIFNQIVKIRDIGALVGSGLGGELMVGCLLVKFGTMNFIMNDFYPVSGLIVRKEQKDHGTKQIIEGPPPNNNKVIILEDVITTGNSVSRVAKTLINQGFEISFIISVFNRSNIMNIDSIPVISALEANDLQP